MFGFCYYHLWLNRGPFFGCTWDVVLAPGKRDSRSPELGRVAHGYL